MSQEKKRYRFLQRCTCRSLIDHIYIYSNFVQLVILVLISPGERYNGRLPYGVLINLFELHFDHNVMIQEQQNINLFYP